MDSWFNSGGDNVAMVLQNSDKKIFGRNRTNLMNVNQDDKAAFKNFHHNNQDSIILPSSRPSARIEDIRLLHPESPENYEPNPNQQDYRDQPESSFKVPNVSEDFHVEFGSDSPPSLSPLRPNYFFGDDSNRTLDDSDGDYLVEDIERKLMETFPDFTPDPVIIRPTDKVDPEYRNSFTIDEWFMMTRCPFVPPSPESVTSESSSVSSSAPSSPSQSPQSLRVSDDVADVAIPENIPLDFSQDIPEEIVIEVDPCAVYVPKMYRARARYYLRRALETPEQREERLRKKREYYYQYQLKKKSTMTVSRTTNKTISRRGGRRATKDPTILAARRARNLASCRKYDRPRLTTETIGNEREARLRRKRECAQRRQANLTVDQRKARREKRMIRYVEERKAMYLAADGNLHRFEQWKVYYERRMKKVEAEDLKKKPHKEPRKTRETFETNLETYDQRIDRLEQQYQELVSSMSTEQIADIERIFTAVTEQRQQEAKYENEKRFWESLAAEPSFERPEKAKKPTNSEARRAKLASMTEGERRAFRQKERDYQRARMAAMDKDKLREYKEKRNDEYLHGKWMKQIEQYFDEHREYAMVGQLLMPMIGKKMKIEG